MICLKNFPRCARQFVKNFIDVIHDFLKENVLLLRKNGRTLPIFFSQKDVSCVTSKTTFVTLQITKWHDKENRISEFQAMRRSVDLRDQNQGPKDY